MLSSSEVIALEDQYESGAYPRQPLVLARGAGATLWDLDGKEYIDCVAGHGIMNIGHGNASVAQAVSAQMAQLVSCPGWFYHEQRARLLETLVRIVPPGLERAFLCNSGAEAVEGALKMARLSTGRTEIVAAMRGFHGRTMGALSATWRKEYREPFAPLLPGVRFVPYNRIAALESAVSEQTAAVILEVVQGEGGVIPGDGEYLLAAQELCADRGALLIIDEVQTGFGRTGRMFACELEGVKPDIMCLGKGITGGTLPLAATLASDRIYEAFFGEYQEFKTFFHGHTYTGNPLACAAALASLELMEKNQVLANLAPRIDQLEQGLAKIAQMEHVVEVRQQGLMAGIELVQDKGRDLPYPPEMRMGHQVILACRKRGVIIRPLGDTVVLMPPLASTAEEIALLLKAVSGAIAEVTGG